MSEGKSYGRHVSGKWHVSWQWIGDTGCRGMVDAKNLRVQWVSAAEALGTQGHP